MTGRGATVLLEENHAIPLVDVVLVIRSGALHDPPGKEGLARICARMLRMGTKKLRADEVDEAIDAMGAALGVDVGHGTISIHGSVIRRSLPQFLELLGELVSAPALRASDLGQAQRETVAELLSRRDNDRWIAGRAFRQHLFRDHPYGRPTMGTLDSVRRIRRSDVAAFVEAHVVASNVRIGVAGDVSEEELRPLIEQAFARLRPGEAPAAPLPVPVLAKGRRVLIADKPGRTQTQVYLGTLGTWMGDPWFYPLWLANTVFGGTTSSRLVTAVRSERGWSYAAQSRLGADRQREAWSVYTHPSVENTVACVELELELVRAFVEDGITESELATARDYLIKSHAFDRDTAAKRLAPRLDAEVYGLPMEFYTQYALHIAGVTLSCAREAVRTRLSADDLSIVLVASAAHIADRLAALPGVREVSVVPFDRV
jgi:zinc protease